MRRQAPVEITAAGIEFDARRFGDETVDVLIEGHRVWSEKLAAGRRRGQAPWPRALRSRLRGSASCELRLSATGARLWSGTVAWSPAGTPDLTDSLGRPVVVNKWGRLSHSFGGDGSELQQRILDLTSRVIAVLESLELPTFVVGGTLLGAVRSGALLPHDDDADLAYLSDFSHPSDLVAEGARIEQALAAIGLRVIRHSWAHLQIAEVAAAGETEFYVDVFTAFFRNNEFCEPIHVRVPASDVTILPLGTVTIGDARYPAPADPDAWLAACYGKQWRTPDPGFTFVTPRDTMRRFSAWFGDFNLHRNTWNDAYLNADELSADVPVAEFEAVVSRIAGAGGGILDLGAGTGASAHRLQALGHTVRCIDYAWNAPCHSHADLVSRVVNLNSYTEGVTGIRSLLGELDRQSDDSTSQHVVMLNRLLGCQDPASRSDILAAVGFALRAGARVLSLDYETLGDYGFERPSSWHLPEETLLAECAATGLVANRLGDCTVVDERGITRQAAYYELCAEAQPHTVE